MAAATVGFLGLDESSLVLAAKLINSGYSVKAHEELLPSVDEFLKIGGVRCATASEAVKGVAALVLLITYPDQLTNIIFSQDGALKGLSKDAPIIIYSTISPVYIQKLEKNLAESLGTAYIVDIYVSKAVSDAMNGKTMVRSCGFPHSHHREVNVFNAYSAKKPLDG